MSCDVAPSFDTAASETRLRSLLVSGHIDDPVLVRWGQRLDRLFRSSLTTSPVPLWAPGLRIDREWRAVTETFLPWREVVPAFRRLITRSLRYVPPSDPLAPFPSWPDFLGRCSFATDSPNPALLLRRLLADESLRRRWLFTLFLPKEHGNGFDRYPRQQEFLRRWLDRQRKRSDGRLSCLDAACGSGEGTWELADLCREHGFMPACVTIYGSSLDPLEIHAAAHPLSSHDLDRQRSYRLRIAPLVRSGFGERLRFRQEDLTASSDRQERYDLVICNGLLGGPILHDRDRMAKVMAGLVVRLRPGGLFLAADRFHEGWQKLTPRGEREALLERCGVSILQIGEGIGGEKEG